MEDGTLTNGGMLFSDNCNVYQSRVFCTRWDGLTKTDADFQRIIDQESTPKTENTTQ